jgi:hypothetical protein
LRRFSGAERENMEKGKVGDSVRHPAHYNQGKIEVIEFIEDKEFGFHRGNAIKYLSRAGKKDPDKELEDLAKAAWYIAREIELILAKNSKCEPRRPNDMNPRTEK